MVISLHGLAPNLLMEGQRLHRRLHHRSLQIVQNLFPRLTLDKKVFLLHALLHLRLLLLVQSERGDRSPHLRGILLTALAHCNRIASLVLPSLFRQSDYVLYRRLNLLLQLLQTLPVQLRVVPLQTHLCADVPVALLDDFVHVQRSRCISSPPDV